MLTIAYMTCRKEPMFQWFADSFRRYFSGALSDVKFVVVDFFADERPGYFAQLSGLEITHVAPKPNVWQGPHRLTKEDWWGAANARNTALCLAPDGFLAYVDDLSVLGPHWLKSVYYAIEGNYTALGAYRKVNNLVVENGEIKSFTPHSEDSRLSQVSHDLTACVGGWLFGASLVGPIADFLKVGGWPEFSDGLKFEDCLMGIGMENADCRLIYDRRMLTTESEELHTGGKSFVARGKKGVPIDNGSNDKAYQALAIARRTKYFENYYPGGIAALRQVILAGGTFPVLNQPTHDWYDNQPIAEMI